MSATTGEFGEVSGDLGGIDRFAQLKTDLGGGKEAADVLLTGSIMIDHQCVLSPHAFERCDDVTDTGRGHFTHLEYFDLVLWCHDVAHNQVFARGLRVVDVTQDAFSTQILGSDYADDLIELAIVSDDVKKAKKVLE